MASTVAIAYPRLWSWSMPRKKSVKLAAEKFIESVAFIYDFFLKTQGLQEEFHSWCTDYAVIRLHLKFEDLMLSALTGAINNNTDTLSESVGLDFPKHLSQDVCTFLIVGDGYFDFKGRDGLIQVAKKFVPEPHYLVGIIKDPQYKDALEQMVSLRNFAAHQSSKSKRSAVKAIGGEKIGSAGSWLRRQDRFKNLCESLKKLASDIEKKAPY